MSKVPTVMKSQTAAKPKTATLIANDVILDTVFSLFYLRALCRKGELVLVRFQPRLCLRVTFRDNCAVCVSSLKDEEFFFLCRRLSRSYLYNLLPAAKANGLPGSRRLVGLISGRGSLLHGARHARRYEQRLHWRAQHQRQRPFPVQKE